MSDLERYHRQIKGTSSLKHSANQGVAKLVLEGNQTFLAQAENRARARKKRDYPPVDDEYLAAKRKRIEERTARVLAGYDGRDPEVFHAELEYLGLRTNNPDNVS